MDQRTPEEQYKSLCAQSPSGTTTFEEYQEFGKAHRDANCIGLPEGYEATGFDLAPEFVKHDTGKRRYDLLPYDALEEIVKVLEAGAEKYDDNNWARGCAWSRYWGACMRHITKWWTGENNDPETGLSHLAHAGCCILFLVAFELRVIGDDDRS